MAFVNFFSLLLASLLLSSCALLGSHTTTKLPVDQAELISRDFVTALSKLRGFSPRETTVQFHNPASDFSKKLHDTLRAEGYGLQIVTDDDSGAHLVSYASDYYETQDGTTVAYVVSVGDVKLSREYEIRAGRAFPITALSVYGATSDGHANVDNSIFKQADNSGWAVVQPATYAAISRDVDTTSIRRGPGDLASEQPVAVLPKRNIADIGQSNYSSLFNHYRPMRTETLVFPNDSLILGALNKSTIYSVAEHFDPATQLISVVGCSIGKTSIDNGNALLANGRANRVKEELIIAGVPHDSILDEGCWAGSSVENVPGRGVILTLQAKIDQG